MRVVTVLLSMFLALYEINVMAADPVEENLAKNLQQVFPDIDVSRVKSTPIENLYEVMIGPDVVYMTGDARFVLKGDLIDMQERRNLSEDVRSQSRADLLKEIPENEYIEFASEDSKDTIYVFTDVDCGYCRKFHKDIPELNNNSVTVRYLAYPRGGVRSPTYNQMVDIWCAEDRPQALTDAKNGMPAIVSTRANCKSPVKNQHALGQQMGMRGTPSIFDGDTGRKIGGYLVPDELLSELGR